MMLPKFRVWHQIKDSFDPKTKEWTYIWCMSAVQILNIIAKEVTIESKYGFANRLHKIGENCILMQSIGVSDIRQQPVFTKDMVKITDKRTGNEYTGVVEEKGAIRYIKAGDVMLTDWDHYDVEIVGNTYESV